MPPVEQCIKLQESLKSVGVELETAFYWVKDPPEDFYKIRKNDEDWTEIIPCPTTDELLAVLPPYIQVPGYKNKGWLKIKPEEYKNKTYFRFGYNWSYYNGGMFPVVALSELICGTINQGHWPNGRES